MQIPGLSAALTESELTGRKFGLSLSISGAFLRTLKFETF